MFDDRLKKLRLARNMTQKEAADALKLKTNTYRNYENDEREPTAMTLLSIARFFGVTIDYLLDYKVKEQEIVPIENILKEDEIKLLNSFNSLEDFQKEMIIHDIELLNRNNEASAKASEVV